MVGDGASSDDELSGGGAERINVETSELGARYRLRSDCWLLSVPGGGILVDWSKTRFFGVLPRDWAEVISALRAEALGDANAAGGRSSSEIIRELLGHRYLELALAPPSRRRVALWLTTVNLLIRVLGFGRTLRLTSVLAPTFNRRDVGYGTLVTQLKRVVESTSRHSLLVSSDCKTEAVTAFLMARRMGLDARLYVGVQQHPLSAHTWTECCGVDIPDRRPGGYSFPVVLVVSP